MKVSIIIPTIEGREEYLERAIRGYKERNETEHSLEFIVEHDHKSVGLGWRHGSERASGDYIHFTNDDIVPGFDYLSPLIEACDKGYVPVPIVCHALDLDEEGMPLDIIPTDHSWAFDGSPNIPNDWTKASDELREYPSLPFCSKEQWKKIGPMIPTHYGTDVWFGYRAKIAGYDNVVRHSFFYHYQAAETQDFILNKWHRNDRLTFDCNISLPMYISGELELDEFHPEWGTDKGIELARDWYKRNIPKENGYYWEI